MPAAHERRLGGRGNRLRRTAGRIGSAPLPKAGTNHRSQRSCAEHRAPVHGHLRTNRRWIPRRRTAAQNVADPRIPLRKTVRIASTATMRSTEHSRDQRTPEHDLYSDRSRDGRYVSSTTPRCRSRTALPAVTGPLDAATLHSRSYSARRSQPRTKSSSSEPANSRGGKAPRLIANNSSGLHPVTITRPENKVRACPGTRQHAKNIESKRRSWRSTTHSSSTLRLRQLTGTLPSSGRSQKYAARRPQRQHRLYQGHVYDDRLHTIRPELIERSSRRVIGGDGTAERIFNSNSQAKGFPAVVDENPMRGKRQRTTAVTARDRAGSSRTEIHVNESRSPRRRSNRCRPRLFTTAR